MFDSALQLDSNHQLSYYIWCSAGLFVVGANLLQRDGAMRTTNSTLMLSRNHTLSRVMVPYDVPYAGHSSIWWNWARTHDHK